MIRSIIVILFAMACARGRSPSDTAFVRQPSAARSSLVLPAGADLSLPSGAMVMAIIRDDSGMPVAGVEVNFATLGGPGIVSPQSSVTDADGTVSASLICAAEPTSSPFVAAGRFRIQAGIGSPGTTGYVFTLASTAGCSDPACHVSPTIDAVRQRVLAGETVWLSLLTRTEDGKACSPLPARFIADGGATIDNTGINPLLHTSSPGTIHLNAMAAGGVSSSSTVEVAASSTAWTPRALLTDSPFDIQLAGSVLYVGINSGSVVKMYRTTNDGTVSDTAVVAPCCFGTGLWADAAHPATVWARAQVLYPPGSPEGGGDHDNVYRTADGATFSEIIKGTQAEAIDLAVDPVSGDTVLSRASGIFRWDGSAFQQVSDVRGARLWASPQGGLFLTTRVNYASRDGGRTWQSFSSPAGVAVQSYALEGSSGTLVAVAVQPGGEPSEGIFFKSTDGGAMWTEFHRSVGRLGELFGAPGLTGIYLARNGRLMRSTDLSTFHDVAAGLPMAAGSMWTKLAFDRASRTLYATNPAGVHKSTTGGE